jgi:DNA transposition AAA+ family ATPase
MVHAALGDREKAEAWLERAYEERDVQKVRLKVDPRFVSLRTDPRFTALVRKMRFPAE